MNKKNYWLLLVFGFLGIFLGWFVAASMPEYKVASDGTLMASKSETLRTDMRKLWEDHAIYTRLYINSAVANRTDKDEFLSRLLKNQEDLGNAVKPYYGDEAGNKLTELLKEHISFAGEVVSAAAAGNNAKLKEADAKWVANGNQIAEFLAGANPKWKEEDLKAMFKEHLDLTRTEASNIIAKKDVASTEDYDRVHGQILNMADMLSIGIINQFPEKFR